MTFSPRRQRGNALLESALSLPLLVGSALLIGDLYNISLARAHLEQSAHSLAATLSMQSRLDTGALEALVQQTASPSLLGDYELLISKVNKCRQPMKQRKPIHSCRALPRCWWYSFAATATTWP
jgi:Flp pilus assembly protein TadG